MPDIYTHHKPVRNKIRKYEPTSIVLTAIKILHEKIDSAHGLEWIDPNGTYYPWMLLNLIRWTFQYTEPNTRLRQISLPEFNDLHNAIYDLNQSIYLEGHTQERALHAYPRRELFRQLPFQIRKYDIMSSFGRQLIMFEDMGANYSLSQLFEEKSGISLKDYFDLYLSCWCACDAGKGGNLSKFFFEGQFSENIISGFFELLALDLQGAKKFIRNHTHAKAAIDYQLNEHTPLELKPFFAHNGRYIPYSARLLDNSFMNNAYDLYKQWNPHFSRDCFGSIFEHYVEKGIYYVSNDFHKESEIKGLLPEDSKAVDFWIKESNSSIFVEAKSTELHSRARVFQSKESLIRNMEDTIIYGVVQIAVTAYHLNQKNMLDADNLYGIIVTYKEYLIGDGKNFWDGVIGDIVTEKLEKLGISNIINPENLFFISISDFDYLVAGAKETNEPLSSILERIVIRNRAPATTCLMVNQHLGEFWSKYYRPAYVTDRCSNYLDSIREKFS